MRPYPVRIAPGTMTKGVDHHPREEEQSTPSDEDVQKCEMATQHWVAISTKRSPAVSYSPTGSPLQYHRR